MNAIKFFTIICLINLSGHMMECNADDQTNIFIDSIFNYVYEYYGYNKKDIPLNSPIEDTFDGNVDIKGYLKVFDNICGNGDVQDIYNRHKVFKIEDFIELEDSVRRNSKYLSKELIDELLLEYDIMISQIMNGTGLQVNDYDSNFKKVKRRYELRKKIGQGLQCNTEQDSVAVNFFHDFIKKMQCYFDTRCANYRINSISIPFWMEREWCVISFFTNGEIVFNPGLNYIDRETFNALKDWYWINKERLSSEPIKEVLKLYDNISSGIIHPVNTENLYTITEYSRIAKKIDRLSLYPFFKIRKFIDDIEK